MYKFVKNYGFGVILSSAMYRYITTMKHRYSLDKPSIERNVFWYKISQVSAAVLDNNAVVGALDADAEQGVERLRGADTTIERFHKDRLHISHKHCGYT